MVEKSDKVSLRYGFEFGWQNAVWLVYGYLKLVGYEAQTMMQK